MEKYKIYKILLGLLLNLTLGSSYAQNTISNQFQIDGFNNIKINSKFNAKN